MKSKLEPFEASIMKTSPPIGVVLFCLLLSGTTHAEQAPPWEIWTVDSLVKVFPDATPEKIAPAAVEVARGEHAAIQVVVRANEPLKNLHAELAALRLEGTETKMQSAPTVRFVGVVFVEKPIQKPPKNQLRKPPAEFPDPLLEVAGIDVEQHKAQALWITIPIPAGTAPGLYQGELSITAERAAGPISYRLPLHVRVFDVVIEKSRLWVTQWFQIEQFGDKSIPKDTPEYWRLLRKYARNMAEHRQNVAFISPLDLADFKAGPESSLEIDFGRFDRWVEIFQQEGVIGRIEGGHLGDRMSGWNSDFGVQVRQVRDGKVESGKFPPDDPQAEHFCARFLPALVAHLREKGWLDIYRQHVADEPTDSNAKSYRAFAQLIRKHAPELKIIEACQTKDLIGVMDVWVPQPNVYQRDFDHYRRRQQAGEEVWFYTCWLPQGEYINRFIEQPLIETRLLHWIGFKYGATGYLHWGYNQWTKEDPFTHANRTEAGSTSYLPAGDAWIVYPGKEGPLDSLRYEAMRDGIADYELLCMLADRDPEAAMRLASRIVTAFDRNHCSVEEFRKTRHELLQSLSQ
jgi:hypothetical protein